MSESYLVGKRQCDKCAEQGKDTSHDNLSVWSDGHTYCFACGFSSMGDQIRSFVARNELDTSKLLKHEVYLPVDSDVTYPKKALEWIEQYELDRNDLLAHRVLWSESRSRLIFPIFNDEQLIAYWGRYFGEESLPKWKGYGSIKTFFHFMGDPSYKKVVMCEDIISAIKLSRFCTSLPLFGTHIGAERFKRLHQLLPEDSQLILWLDPDMHITSCKQTYLGLQYGMRMSLIMSEKDPKEHTLEEIKCYLNLKKENI